MILYGGPVAWNASKQATVTTSSTEAELLGLSFAAKEVIATMRLFAGLRFHLDENLIIWCDNKQTIRLVAQELQRLRTALRYVDVHQCWVRQEVQRGTFALRSPARPNPIAMSVVKLLGVEGNKLSVVGLDCLDGTPLLDIKPYFASTDSVPDAVVGWHRDR